MIDKAILKHIIGLKLLKMQLPDFLNHLQQIAGSPLAFIGYICVIALWVYFIWINQKRNLIDSFNDDSSKLKAYKELIRDHPPVGVDHKTWYATTLKHKRMIYLFASFVATLVTILLICTLAIFNSISNTQTKEDAETQRQKNHTRTVNSNDSASFNKNRGSFNKQKTDSALKINSDDKSSFNENDSSFNN